MNDWQEACIMTSVEKRRSGRKSGGHRKHSDGGYSDTSSAGSFLDETDREVSNLTDRAFRSLCIGDEAVYNDSDLSAASPYTQRDRQLAFSQSAQTRDREELKRAAHESFSLRMQQYGQDWIHRGMYGAEIQRDPQWEVYGERTQGRVSATFQQSFMGTPREEESPGGEQLSLLSNGTTDMSSQQRRSRSRVSSLIRAFNSEGHRDGAVIDGNLREWSDDTTWDKSALMSIQRELSEFSSSYQENFNSGHFPAVGPLSAQETNFYASEVAAMTHMNSGSSFLTSSHSKHSVAAQVNSNSNFFIHSEFSPFKVWRDHNRFPFQQGEVSGFMHYPDFPRWYQTPMYKELSLETQPQGPYRFGEERGFRHPRSNFAPDVPPALPRSTSTSTMLQKTSALEKRCDSELTGHYTYRKRTQSLGANRLPAQRPSTASPTVEMSRRVQDTISSVRALQQKIKMMTEQNISNQPGVAYSNENHAPFGNYETAPNVVSNNTSTTPFNVSQPRQYAASPQPVEHPPVRAESRGATPDIRSSYKSRATNLLFNLKDNRKRVKSTYSPPKFKGPEAQERVKQPPIQEPRDTVIDMPDFLDGDVQYPQGEKSNHHYVNQYHNPGSAITTTTNYDPVTAYAGQYSEYAQHNYQIQPEMVHQSAFRHENYTNNQLTNGQCLHEDLQFIPYEQGTMGNEYRHQPLYTGTEIPRVHADNNQTRDLVGQRDNSYDYSNVSAQDGWRQTNSQDVQPQNLNAALSPWKQEMERQQLDYQRVAMMRAEPCLPRDAYGRENAHTSVNTNMSNQLPQYRALSSNTEGNPASYGQQQQQQQQQQSGAFKGWQRKDDKEIEIKDASSSQTFNQYTHQEYRNQNILSEDKDTFRRKQHTPTPNRPEELKPPRNYNPDNVSEPKVENQAKERKSEDVKPGQDMAVNVKVKHAQEELALAQHWAKEQQPEVEPARLNLAEQTGSGEVRAETVPAEPSETQRVNQDRGDHVKEQSTDKQPEVAKQTPAQTETDEPSEVREEAGAEHMKEEQDEQVRVTQAEAERVKEEHIKTEQERIEQAATRERINAEILQDEKLRAEQAERQRAEEEKVKAELKEKEEQEKAQQVEARVDEINNTPQIITDTAERVEERFEEQANLKETTTKPQPTIKEMIQEMSAKTAKPAKPALPQPAKSEPDKVEQVKTELAKAKAELAKIKEKMRGEQKHKVKITAPTKEDEIAKEVCGSTPQQSEDLGVTSRVTDTANRGLYEYNLLKEKYGFTDSPIIINNPPAAGNVSLNDANETPDLSSDRLETTNEKSKDSLTNKSETANTANTDDVSSFKPNELTESQYVYSESSKEFKLSNSIPTVEEKTANSGDKTTTTGESIGKVKEDRVDPLIQPVRDSIIVPQPPVERKLKDHPPNPPKTLSHKDRSQTKQELLTSKIKAHAEKEISAIREKGFALRDGLMSKSSSKQFGGGQVGSVRQRPPSQETPKKHDSTTSSNTKPKHQNESQGIQMAPVSSAAIQAKSATTTSQLVDGFQKVPKDETVSKQPRDQNKDKESLRPSKEQPSKNKQGNHGDTVQKKEAPPTMKEKTESEHEAVLEDSAPTLSLVLGPNTTPVEDESLQIRGIMVTVRERKPSLTVTDYPQDQIQATAAAEVNSEINKYPSSDLDSSKGNKAPKKVSKAETEDKVEQDAHDKTEESMSVDYENTKGTKQNNRSENVGGKRSEELLHGPYTDTRPQREIQPQEPLAEKSSPTTLTVPAKNKTLAETQPLLHTTTTKTLKENSTTWEEMVDIKSPTQETNLQRGGTTAPDDFNVGMKTNHHINNSNVTETERKTKSDIQPTEEDEKHHLAPTNKCNPSENDNVENTQVDENVHIDSIAIRVVPAVIEDNVRKAETERVSSDVTASNKQVSSSIVEGTMKTPRKEETTKDSQTPLEDNSVQSVLEGVKQLSDSLKTATRNPGNSADESKTQPSEGDYFQVQGKPEPDHKPDKNVKESITDTAPERREYQEKQSNKRVFNKESNNDRKNEVFVLDQSKVEVWRSASLQEESVKRKSSETGDNLALKQSHGPRERYDPKHEKSEADQAVHSKKQDTESKSSVSSRERLSARNANPSKEYEEKPEVKPKPKPRVSTIPEISALADYARLKVIVSEEQENPVQEFPPNKKEGFFPLIQTRHSRRPVFTADPQDFTVKEKALPKKTEASAKVSKEPKPLVFPITEKEHQRTGMFKLGDKERQEKFPSDAKASEDVADPKAKHAQYTQEKNKTPQSHLKKQGGEDLLSTNAPRSQQEDLSQSNHLTSSLTNNRTKPGDDTCPQRNPQEFSPNVQYLDKNSHHTPTSRQANKTQETTDSLKGKQTENSQATKDTLGKTQQERLVPLHEDSKAKQQNTTKQEPGKEEKKRAEDMKIKHIIEESRASLAEEERRAAKREEERRAREREAIANKIRERRERQKEAERRGEEERVRADEERDIQKEKDTKEKEEVKKVKKTEDKGLKLPEKEQGLASRDVLQKRGAPEEQQRRAAQEEEEEKQRKAAKETQRRAAQEEQEKRAAQEELQRRAAQEEQERIAAKEEQRRAAQEEQRRRAAEEEKQKRAAQEEQRRAAQEQQRIAAQEEQQRRAAQEERRRAAQEEQQRRAAKEEQQRRAAQEEQQRRAAQEEQQRRAAQEEQQRRAAQEEQRIAAQEEQQRRAAQEEQQRIAAHEERMKAAQEEQHRRAAQEKQQRRAAEEEKQRIAAQEEQRRAAQEEEKQRKAAQEERKRAAEEEKKRRLAQEEQQKRAVEEEQRRAAQEEQRRAVHEEQLRRAAQMEQRRRAAEEEKQRRAVEEEQRRAAEEEQQRRAAQEEQERREAEIELQKREESQRRAARRAAREEQQRRAAQEERERRAAQEEQERRAAQEEQERRAALEEQKRREKQEEQERQAVLEEEQWRAALIEEQRQAKQLEEKIRTKVDQHYEKQTEEKEMRAEKDRAIKESQAATKDEEGLTQEQMLIHKDGREQVKPSTKMDALQYYAITSTNSEKKPRERELDSPLPPHQRNHPMGQESSEDPGTHARSYRPHAPASPAPSHPRSNTSSPAPGVRPSMFRVKDNTFKASSFTKSVKPRFHKTFGEDYRVGSPMERGEEEQEKMRRGAGTPVHPDMGSNRFSAIREFSGFQPASSSHDHSGSAPQHRPYSRRSIALDEDDSRSVVSNMSEGVESFATSAADLSELRGLYYDERPESACSFSSDVSRSMGKPPAVPPKSEKALRRAKRLTSRRINKELTKAGGDSSAVDKPLHDVSNIPEVRSPNSHAMASPHFSSPVSLAHAPALGSSLPSSHTEHPSINASPHATGPISLQVASPHATAPVSLPHASHAAAPQTVAHVPPSPTLHRAKHPAPVTQYHVESTYPQSYPLTQRKVLQDIGSGQYFVVDVPVPVKTKTFIDPETGKYVQLNVRESAQNAPRPPPKPQPQQTYQQPLPQASPAGKPVVLYEGYHGYPQGYKPAANKSVPHHRSSAPVTAHQDQQQVRESSRYGYPAPEIRQNSEGPRYSPEKTPYMDTVNDSDKTYNAVYNTHGPYESFPECDTNSQLAGSAVCENDNSAHSRYQPREIISIGELEDFMELSDW